MTKYNFITPNGLKVRLHAPLLFSLISGNPEELSAEEMLNNAQIAGALNWIDALFSFRLPADNYLVGSEVKVIIIKED